MSEVLQNSTIHKSWYDKGTSPEEVIVYGEWTGHVAHKDEERV